MKWTVYIIRCDNDKLYTGATNDLEKRFRAHRSGKGARFTRGFGAAEIVYREECVGRKEALRREREIKSWDRRGKLELIQRGRGRGGARPESR